jgi:hypothetical protein
MFPTFRRGSLRSWGLLAGTGCAERYAQDYEWLRAARLQTRGTAWGGSSKRLRVYRVTMVTRHQGRVSEALGTSRRQV